MTSRSAVANVITVILTIGVVAGCGCPEKPKPSSDPGGAMKEGPDSPMVGGGVPVKTAVQTGNDLSITLTGAAKGNQVVRLNGGSGGTVQILDGNASGTFSGRSADSVESLD